MAGTPGSAEEGRPPRGPGGRALSVDDAVTAANTAQNAGRSPGAPLSSQGRSAGSGGRTPGSGRTPRTPSTGRHGLGGAFTPASNARAPSFSRGTPLSAFQTPGGAGAPPRRQSLGRSDLGARTPGSRRFVRGRSRTPFTDADTDLNVSQVRARPPLARAAKEKRGEPDEKTLPALGAQGGGGGGSEGGFSQDQTMFVWGTNVNIQAARQDFFRFFNNFMEPTSIEPKYPTLLRETIQSGGNAINLDCMNLYQYDENLYWQLVKYPQEIIPIFDLELDQYAHDIHAELSEASDRSLEPYRIQVRTFNLKDTKSMRQLDPTDIDQMISVQGMVTRVSGVIPDLKHGQLKCSVCGFEPEPIPVDRGRLEEPQRCPNPECNAMHSMDLEHNRSLFGNKQMIKLQETPDNIPEGETARTMTMYVFDDLVDVIKPGDRIAVTGVYRAIAPRVNPRARTQKSVFRTYIDVIHIGKEETRQFAEMLKAADEAEAYTEGDTTRAMVDARVQQLKALATDPDVYEKLVASLAPSVWELDDVKKGILCLLFGGSNKEQFGVQQKTQFRGEINCLLCGDPGTSKSQILGYVHKLAPRGIYTSGRGSSAVGLTAYVSRDPETRDMVLESGALVLSDMGVCCIDEFDKMSDSARGILHEVMEQQTVSVAKAGIICTLNARTSILASANPVGSRYNSGISVIDNLQLPPSLMSRFDLIFLVLDKAEKETDAKLARHLVAMHYEHPPENRRSIIPAELLKDYIAYARAQCQPRLTDAASEALVNYYVEMRQMGSAGSNKVITFTPRQLESLVRISEAIAKMRLAEEVTEQDVGEAYRLVKVAMQSSATDPRTGKIDMDLIQTGISASTRAVRKELASELQKIIATAAGPMHIQDLRKEIMAQTLGQDIAPNEIREAVSLLVETGDVNLMGDVVRAA